LRIIGLGQALAGDDGAGSAVLRALRTQRLPQDIELLEIADPSALVELCESAAAILLLDAVLGKPAGELVELSVEALSARAPAGVSSHGLGVTQALGLARALAGDRAFPAVRIIAITIEKPERYARELTPAVAAAVPRAVQRVLARVTEHTSLERART
jgi:hydrogenase maturation protease